MQIYRSKVPFYVNISNPGMVQRILAWFNRPVYCIFYFLKKKRAGKSWIFNPGCQGILLCTANQKKIPGKNQKQNLDSSSRVVSLHKTFTYFIVENAVNQMACTLSSSGLVPLKLSHVRHSCVRTMKVRYCRVIIGLKTKNNFSPVL